MTFKLESAITRKVMKLDDRRQHNGDPCFREQPCTDHEGRDLKTALTAPIGYRRPKTIHTDHEGNVFNTQREMCKAWGVSESLYRMRRIHGLSQKQALTAPKGYSRKEVRNDTNTAC